MGKALALGLLVCVSLPIACGDTDDNPGSAKGGTSSSVGGEASAGGGAGPGTGGAAALPPGLSDTSMTVKCGTESCSSVGIALAGLFIDPCCPADSSDTCGVTTTFLEADGASFTEACQAVDQPGELDEACPATEGSVIPFEMGGQTVMLPLNGFAGCCREDSGTCGVVVDAITSSLLGALPLASFGLGCVDAAPFFPDAEPAACGAGVGGAGGGGNSGGNAGEAPVGGASAGGAGAQ